MVQPTLGAAFTHALEAGRNLGPRGMPVTLERVTQVFEDGRVEVKGVRIPITGGGGARGVRAGQMIAVSWQRGQPVVAIRHSARRTGPVSPQPRVGGGVVEELIYAPIQQGNSTRDNWFRNDTVLGRLHTALGGQAKWGLSRSHFFTTTFGVHTEPIVFYQIYHVYTIGAPDGTPRTPDQVLTDVPTATLVASYDISQSPITLGTYTTMYTSLGDPVIYNPPVVLGTLFTDEYNSGDGFMLYRGVVEDAMIDERGHLLVALKVIIFYNHDFAAFQVSHVPYVVDLTDGVVIFDGLTQAPALFGVTAINPTLVDLDNLPENVPYAIYEMQFCHAAVGDVSLIMSAWYHGAGPSQRKWMIRTPTTSLVLQDLTATFMGIYYVGGLSEGYAFWVPFPKTTDTGDGLFPFLPVNVIPPGAIATLGVNMTRFNEPSDTVQVSADLDSFFTPRLILLDPTAFYNTTDDNDTGHFFVEFLEANGDIALDTAAAGFPLRDTRPNEKAGFLLEYPEDLAFIEAYLAAISEGETPVDAFGKLTGVTSYQLILDTTVAGELPI
jgi:hypothetical protein